MNTKRRIASWLYFSFAAGTALTGLVYAASPRFMPYHAEIAGMAWQDVPERLKLLHLAFQHGAGMLAASFGGLFAAVTARAFRPQSESWADLALPLSGFAVGLPLLDIVLSLSSTTGARTPALPLLAGLLMLAAGACLTLPQRFRKSQTTQAPDETQPPPPKAP